MYTATLMPGSKPSSGLSDMHRKFIRHALLILLALFVMPPPPAAFGDADSNEAAISRGNGSAKTAPLVTRFVGNSNLSERELHVAAALEFQDLEHSVYRDSLADDAAFQMEKAYNRAGFAFASVDYSASHQDHEVVLIFSVIEGPRVLLEELHLEGNIAFSDEKLLPYFNSKHTGLLGLGQQIFVENDLDEAASSVRDLYYSEGYLNVSIKEPQYSFSPERDRVTVTVPIEEGSRIVIGAIEYRGDVLPAAENALDQAKRSHIGEPFFRRRKLLLKSRVQEIYGNLGFPDTTVELSEEQQGEAVILTCTITSGPKVTISSLTITGNNRTQEAFIMDRLALQTGDTFSLNKQRETFRNLQQTGLFQRVGLEFTDGEDASSRTLAIELEEAKARQLFFYTGWGSYEMLRGGAGFQDNNLFGTGRTFLLEAGASLRSENVQATWIDPWLLGHGITVNIPVYFRRREEPSFTREEMGSSVMLTKTITKNLELTLGYLYKQTTISEIAAVADIANLESDYTVASAKAQTTWDSRNDLFFPTKGLKLYGAIEAAEPAIGSELSFWRLTAGLRHFTKLARKTTLGLRYDTGLIVPGRNQITIPLGERFFNGGENSVRSFKESELGPHDLSGNPVGGLAYNVASIELRQQFGHNTAATLFVDYGNIAPNRSLNELNKPPYTSRSEVISDTLDDYFSDFRPALGVGLLYLLPIGPVRLDFAWNPDLDEDRGEDELTIHFSIGMAF
jgi:outer membrane protein insertion porin family